jgi:hypothetical protein
MACTQDLVTRTSSTSWNVVPDRLRATTHALGRRSLSAARQAGEPRTAFGVQSFGFLAFSSAICARAAAMSSSFVFACPARPHPPPWTAHGFLLVALDRPDVFLPGDIALRRAIQNAYGIDHVAD